MLDALSDYERAVKALDSIRRVAGTFEPATAVVLGSGLGSVADEVESARILNTAEIPGWPLSTAPGHAGRIVMGTLEGRPVILLQGRVHFYEGYSMREVTFPVRVLGMMGVRQYVATNASGGVDPDLAPGDIVAVRDHINLMGANPLTGASEPRWNVRFPDMTHAYSPRLLEVLDRAAAGVGIALKRGVYAAFMGPSYETPAEVRMARILGADLVGMSTVPEVIVANAMGMETAVLSCVANRAAGMGDEHLTEEDVLRVMADSSHALGGLLRALMRALASDGR
ncbi:purine-nucleoside phosphorylase [Fretibacterium sp. OH1220_COT-178]|uniref:purine-nucleoside phosphorylase n=1 Tax=Fretibacterium sp. OH1220_COT-178 TaxID=2491047 RepID=UPI000F5F3EAB|nr:purine-nucleoside phosphorylase [Fretibacterium sp. OH1220_COT-178]RRD64134.1 purine-nucleoside phosphorylase [Fretibacterium sp. OH1220_COT-178]